MWVYYSFLQPVVRLVEKTLIPAVEGRPAGTKRRYDQARTPFDRLCETDAINQNERDRLQTLREGTNPRKLRQEIYQLIDYLFSLSSAVQGRTENVHETLVFPLTFYEKGADAPVTSSFDLIRWPRGSRLRLELVKRR